MSLPATLPFRPPLANDQAQGEPFEVIAPEGGRLAEIIAWTVPEVAGIVALAIVFTDEKDRPQPSKNFGSDPIIEVTGMHHAEASNFFPKVDEDVRQVRAELVSGEGTPLGIGRLDFLVKEDYGHGEARTFILGTLPTAATFSSHGD